NGGRARMLEVELDERRIQALGLSVQDVGSRIAQIELIREAGVVVAPGGLHFALAIREGARSAAEVEALPLLTDAGRIVRVRDVARVYDTFEELRFHQRFNGYPAVMMQVYRE